MPLALLSLGSNLGDRLGILEQAIAALANAPEIRIISTSAWRETQPIGGPPGQAAFLNGAALLETSLPPEELLERLQEIETQAGRTRDQRWGARSLDLDLLLYDDAVLDTPQLTLPHPRMAFRRFVLQPAVEVAPDMRHPLIGWTIRELYSHLNTAPSHVAIIGANAKIRAALAQRIASRLPNSAQLTFPSCSSSDEELAMHKLILWLDGPEKPEQIAQPFAAPWLRLDSADLDAATEEALAAIQAMQ